MNLFRLLKHGLLSGFCMGCFCLSAVQITDGSGTAAAEIILPEGAEESSKLAARELAEYVAKISGGKLAVTSAPGSAANQIIIGTLQTLKDVPQEIRTRLEATQNNEAFCLMARGSRLYIVGKKRVAELFAAYTFLEEHLDVRWFIPPMQGDDGEYIAKRKAITIKDFFTFREPCFVYRRQDETGCGPLPEPLAGKSWLARNKFHAPGSYNALCTHFTPQYRSFFEARVPGHVPEDGQHTTFSEAIPIALFKTNPEYFAMIDGKRVLRERHGLAQYCISNPGVKKRVLEYVDKLFAKYGVDNIAFLFSQTDMTDGFCECKDCRAVDGSTLFHNVAAELSSEIFKKYPTARLRVWAYASYRPVPADFRYDPRVEIIFCNHGRSYGSAFNDPKCGVNVNTLKEMQKWLKHTKNIQSYEYWTPTETYYVPVEYTLAEDLRFYKKLGLRGWKDEIYLADANLVPKIENDPRKDCVPAHWQYFYVASRLSWDPDQDVDAIIADGESKYYGKAYPAMKKYHEFRRKLWQSFPGDMGWGCGKDNRRPNLLNYPGSTAKLLGLLDEAEKLAAGDEVRLNRIKRDRHYLKRYWIKPNDELRARRGKTFSAPKVSGKITIDGNGSESDWMQAFYTSDFKAVSMSDAKSPMPPELRTEAGIMVDDENFYFLLTAKEPQIGRMKIGCGPKGNLWEYDSMEVFLAPPNNDASYFQIIAAPDGALKVSKQPGNRPVPGVKVEAVGKIFDDRYVIELKVPAKALCSDFRRGSLWKIHFTRNRTVKDAFNTGKDGENLNYCLNGELNHSYNSYQIIEIGQPYLKNSSLDKVKDNKPVDWEVLPDNPVRSVKTANGYAVKFSGKKEQRLAQILIDPELWQSPEARRISISFKTWGKGKMDVAFFVFTDIPNPKAPNGHYDRKCLSSDRVKSFAVASSAPMVRSLKYTIRENQWVALVFYGSGEVYLDDVSVKLLK